MSARSHAARIKAWEIWCALNNITSVLDREGESFEAGFEAGWAARGEADLAAVEWLGYEMFGRDALRAIAALDETGVSWWTRT